MDFRAPRLEDAEAVLGVLAARDIADLGAPDYTLADLLDDWSSVDFELAADALIAVTEDQRIAGYAASSGRGTYAVVAPEQERKGIGRRLLDWSERPDRELGRKRHRQGLPASDERGRALLVAAGYERCRSYSRLTRALDHRLETHKGRDAVTLRPFELGLDVAGVHALSEASFAANADFGRRRSPASATSIYGRTISIRRLAASPRGTVRWSVSCWLGAGRRKAPASSTFLTFTLTTGGVALRPPC